MDGGSTDASVAIAEAAGLLVVQHETRGRAAAITRGVQEATAPIICVLHADTLLPDDAVAVMRRVLADPGTALAGFTPLLSGPDQVRWGTSFHNWIKTWYAPLLFRPLRANWIYLKVGARWGLGFRKGLELDGKREPDYHVERADAVVNRVVITLRSPGRRLGRAAGELDLPQGRSMLGAWLSQRAGAALPRRALNRSPAEIAAAMP